MQPSSCYTFAAPSNGLIDYSNPHTLKPLSALYGCTYEALIETAEALIQLAETTTPRLDGVTVVHEAFLALSKTHTNIYTTPTEGARYFRIAMRLVINQHQRRAKSKKRIPLDCLVPLPEEEELNIQQENYEFLEEALLRISADFPRAHHTLILYYWYGLKVHEIAPKLNVVTRTTLRDLKFIRQYLQTLLPRITAII